MNIFVTRILGLGLFGVMATTGALQAAQQAKFHLPVAVTWANVTLPAGDYTVSLPEIGTAQSVFTLNGEGKRAFIPVMCTYHGPNSAVDPSHSVLVLRNINGNYYVQSYESGPSEKEFSFKIPKTGVKVQFGKNETVKLDVAGE